MTLLSISLQMFFGLKPSMAVECDHSAGQPLWRVSQVAGTFTAGRHARKSVVVTFHRESVAKISQPPLTQESNELKIKLVSDSSFHRDNDPILFHKL